MTDFQVHVRYTCGRCSGAGTIEAPEWARWWAAHPIQPGQLLDEEFYADCPRYAEETTCPDCDDGYVDDWVPLSELHQDCGAECDCYRRGREERP